jgi:hypothetical protein
MHYIPKVDDYVRWKDHQGWVYFKCDESISIEIGVKDVVCHKGTCHKKNHILLVCQRFQWDELEYIKNRRNEDDTYKSQVGRYLDPQ